MEGPVSKSKFIQVLKNGWNCNDTDSKSRGNSVTIKTNLDRISSKIFFINQELRKSSTTKRQVKSRKSIENKVDKEIRETKDHNYFDILGQDD